MVIVADIGVYVGEVGFALFRQIQYVQRERGFEDACGHVSAVGVVAVDEACFEVLEVDGYRISEAAQEGIKLGCGRRKIHVYPHGIAVRCLYFEPIAVLAQYGDNLRGQVVERKLGIYVLVQACGSFNKTPMLVEIYPCVAVAGMQHCPTVVRIVRNGDILRSKCRDNFSREAWFGICEKLPRD